MSSRARGFLARRGGASLSPAHVAGRAAEIIKEQVESVVAAAEASSAEAQREAAQEAAQVRGEAVASASRTLESIEQVESRLSGLTSEIKLEADSLRAILGRSAARADAEVRELEASTSAAVPAEPRVTTVRPGEEERERERAERISRWSTPEPHLVDAEVVPDPQLRREESDAVKAPRAELAPLPAKSVAPRRYQPTPPVVDRDAGAVETEPAIPAKPTSVPPEAVSAVEVIAPQAEPAPPSEPAPDVSPSNVAADAPVAPESIADGNQADDKAAAAPLHAPGDADEAEAESTGGAADEPAARAELASHTDLELAAAYNESREELWKAELQGNASELQEWRSVVEALVAEAVRRVGFGLGRQAKEGWGFLGRRRRERQLQPLSEARQAALGSSSPSSASPASPS